MRIALVAVIVYSCVSFSIINIPETGWHREWLNSPLFTPRMVIINLFPTFSKPFLRKNPDNLTFFNIQLIFHRPKPAKFNLNFQKTSARGHIIFGRVWAKARFTAHFALAVHSAWQRRQRSFSSSALYSLCAGAQVCYSYFRLFSACGWGRCWIRF